MSKPVNRDSNLADIAHRVRDLLRREIESEPIPPADPPSGGDRR